MTLDLTCDWLNGKEDTFIVHRISYMGWKWPPSDSAYCILDLEYCQHAWSHEGVEVCPQVPAGPKVNIWRQLKWGTHSFKWKITSFCLQLASCSTIAIFKWCSRKFWSSPMRKYQRIFSGRAPAHHCQSSSAMCRLLENLEYFVHQLLSSLNWWNEAQLASLELNGTS